MIRKPSQDWRRESAAVTTVRAAAIGGAAAAVAGSYYVRGLICWALALVWGFAALAAGLGGSVPTLIGVGLMACWMGRSGAKLFAKARG